MTSYLYSFPNLNPTLPWHREDLAAYKGPWPKRMFLGMGSREYSSTRPKEPATHKWDRLLVSYAVQLTRLLRGSGMDSSRLQWQVSSATWQT